MTGTAQITTGAENQLQLAKSRRRTNLGTASLLTPSLALVALLVVLPCLWLFWLSAFDQNGQLTTENYRLVLTSASYRTVFFTTFNVAFLTVAICVLIGVPFSAFLASLPKRKAQIVLTFVLLPFWTSLLVRSYAWLVLLQRQGLVNTLLMDTGVVDEPLSLVFNTFAAVLGMVHIMLPIFILPVYGVMSRLDDNLMRAAASLGASWRQAIKSVFLPLAAPGIAAGSIMVMVMSLGFFVTPAILGGGKVFMIAMRIERSLSNFTSYGAASALGVLLLVATGLLLLVSAYLTRRLTSKS